MTTGATNGLEGTLCHIDDVLLLGRTEEQHDIRLHAVLGKMQKEGMTHNVEKCELSKRKVHFLGHIIAADDISPDTKETAAVRDMRQPSNERTVELPGDGKSARDALFYGLEAVLMQRWLEGWKPIAYALRTLTLTKQKYAQVEKDALDLTRACKRFKDFLIVKHFELVNDHKPLLSLLGSQLLDALPPLMLKMQLMIFSYSTIHVSGKSLWVADTLSCASVKQKQIQEERVLGGH